MHEKNVAPGFPNPDVFNPRSLAASFNVASRLYSGFATPNMNSPRINDNLNTEPETSKILIND